MSRKIKLRKYQEELIEQLYEIWDESPRKNVLIQLSTGGGKSVIIGKIIEDLAARGHKVLLQVHRKELVSQLSLALCKFGLYHDFICPMNTLNQIKGLQKIDFKKEFYKKGSNIIIGSVDTIISREKELKESLHDVKYAITDEAAHVLKENKWGRALAIFPKAINIGFTATPERLDRKGLGSHNDGVFDEIILGPSTQWLIDHKFLSKYKIVAPLSDFEGYLPELRSDKHDYTAEQIQKAADKSQIVGDVVFNYKKSANGTQAIVFAPTRDIGTKMAKKFNASKIPAVFISSSDDDYVRFKAVNDFKNNKIRVLLNVDLFDEGFDISPVTGKRIVETVIMARPTMSVSKYLQQAGRALRPSPDKEFGILIDHCGNIKRHFRPCKERTWSLERPEKKKKGSDEMRTCQCCRSVYEKILTHCPDCGEEAFPREWGGGGRNFEEVDGDLELIDVDTLREMEEKAILDSPEKIAQRVALTHGIISAKSAATKQREKIERQKTLKQKITKWIENEKLKGLSERSANKKYFLKFKQTCLQSLAETPEKMKELMGKLDEKM